jgi:hypothetical protein
MVIAAPTNYSLGYPQEQSDPAELAVKSPLPSRWSLL